MYHLCEGIHFCFFRTRSILFHLLKDSHLSYFKTSDTGMCLSVDGILESVLGKPKLRSGRSHLYMHSKCQGVSGMEGNPGDRSGEHSFNCWKPIVVSSAGNISRARIKKN